MYREIYILRRLRHVSLIPLIDAFFPKYNQESLIQLHDVFSNADTLHSTILPRPLCFAFEYMDCDLQKYLKSTSTTLSQEQIQFMMFQLLCGLQYIHSKNVIHRDLKSENILINLNSCSAKIADFGLSRVDTLSDNKVNEVVNLLSVSTPIDTDDEALPSLSLPRAGPRPVPAQRGYTKHIATRHYRAPEVILLQPYSAPVDVWSMGCIFGEMLGCEAGNKDAYGKRDALMPGSA
jgi:mitogen-activated protein kinase 1/3